MDYPDFLDHWVETQVYPQIPENSDAWQNDVFEYIRLQWADQWRQMLAQLLKENIQSETGKAMAESIDADVFGNRPNGTYMRPMDKHDARIVDLIPPHTEDVPLDEALETMQLCASHVAYKFYKWKASEELSDLLVRCEDIPEYLRTDYAQVFSAITGVIMNALAVLHCDLVAKPNFRRIESVAKLYKQLNAFGERIWAIVETLPEKEPPTNENGDDWGDDDADEDED